MKKNGLAVISLACFLIILSVNPISGSYNLDLFIFSFLLVITGAVMFFKGGRAADKD